MSRWLGLLAVGCMAPWGPFDCGGEGTPTDTGTPGVADLETSGMGWLAELRDPAVDALCPKPDNAGFRVGRLFDVGQDDCPFGCTGPETPDTVPMEEDPSRLPAAEAPGRLVRYCLYQATDPDNDTAPDLTGGANSLVAGPERSRKLVGSAATPRPAGEELRDYYVAKTRAEVGFCPVGTQGKVRLAFLDTVPTGPFGAVAPGAVVEDAHHGLALATGIDELLCAAGVCGGAIDLRYRAAMPLQYVEGAGRSTWNVAGGGAFGPLDWLAQAVVREVHAWQADNSNNHLVINLSLGWHPSHGGDPAGGGPRIDERAVYDALRYARCRGALIVAAAGNRTGDNLDDGPIYPAGWGTSVITRDTCKTEFGIEPAEGKEMSGPLLYAVGGVQNDDEPLAISRIDSTPHLVAYAQNFETAEVRRRGLQGLTGTSVAAAVVSGAAARVWAEDPGLSPEGVISRVWDGATPTPTSPEGLFAGAPPRAIAALRGFDGFSRRVAGAGGGCTVDDPLPLPLWSECAADPERCSAAPAGTATPGDPFPSVPRTSAFSPYATPAPNPRECPVCGLDLSLPQPRLFLDLQAAPATKAELATRVGGSWTRTALDPITSPGTYEVPWVDPATERAALLYTVGSVGFISEVHILR